MTSNPLARRSSHQDAPQRHMPRTPQEDADMRNAMMRAQSPQRAHEIEWYVGQDNRVYLRDRPDWSARRTREIEATAERDREDWKRAQRQAGNL